MITAKQVVKALTRKARGNRNRAAGEDGAALITALIFLLLLTALGLASVMTSSTEMMIARNDRLNKLALDYANAGVQAAMAQLDADQIGSDYKAKLLPAADPGPWSFNSSSTQLGITTMNFDGTVAYRTEDSIHWVGKGESPQVARSVDGDNQVIGYSKSCGYGNASVTFYDKSYPVYQITSRGWVGDSANPDATATVVADVSKNTIDVNVRSALDATCLQALGTAHVYGASNCGGATDNKPAYSTQCASPVTGGAYNDDYGVTGVPPETSAPAKTIEDRLGMSLDDLRALAVGNGTYYHHESGVWLEQNSPGPADDDPYTLINNDQYTGFDDIVYVQADDIDFHPTGGTNTGILIVEGNLITSGNFVWNGLVYVTGNLTTGAGAVVINGSVIVDGALADLGGTITIQYDCNNLEKLSRNAFHTLLLNWQRQYN